ncbi:MAG: nucleotidyltransferase family protein [Lachnospiraceae bacterium]|nr:nucleotidyltransferase family protein [Lachnospiraceae bacterium]
MKVHFLYLAAGFSRRYGGNKLLDHVIEGRPMYRILLDRLIDLLETGAVKGDLVLVTQYEEILQQTAELDIYTAVNPDPGRGISSSLQTGIQALQERGSIGEEDFLVCFTADQPYLTKETVLSFLKGITESGKTLGCVSDGRELGNPCAFGAEWIPALMELTGDRGGKRILRMHPEEVYVYVGAQSEELNDIDLKQ